MQEAMHEQWDIMKYMNSEIVYEIDNIVRNLYRKQYPLG